MILRVRKRPGMEGEDVLKGAGEDQVGAKRVCSGPSGKGRAVSGGLVP